MKSSNDTICHKVDVCMDMLEEALKTKSLDPGAMGELLHGIRTDAGRMEKALKLRKKLMTKAKIEDNYQKLKDKSYTPTGKNLIAAVESKHVKEMLDYEFILKEKGKIVYQHKAHAGVLSVVEKVTDLDENGFITGVTQKFYFGQPMVMWFAFDQLKQGIESYKLSILTAIKNNAGKFKNPADRKKLLDGFKRMSI